MKTSSAYPNLSRLSWEQRLSLYGLAVGASLAAGVSPAHANLITLDLTGQPIGSRTTPVGGNLFFDVNAPSAPLAFGTTSFVGADFRLTHPASGVPGINGLASNNGIAGSGIIAPKAFNLNQSNFVGPTDNFLRSAILGGFPFGAWNPGDTGFLGLRFDIGPDTHFGWANVTENVDESVTLNALGYETIPDTAAHVEGNFAAAVPDHGSTLVLLAIGASGLLAFRRQQQKAA